MKKILNTLTISNFISKYTNYIYILVNLKIVNLEMEVGIKR